MARYSSESDSDQNSRYRRKRSRRSKSSSSDSSDSISHRRRPSKHSKTKRRHRSHSRSRDRDRDRSQKSYKSSRKGSSSKGRERHRYHSRSRSSDRSKRKARSTSREKSGSRSSSSQSNIKSIMPEKAKTVLMKDEFPIEPWFKEDVLEEINSEGFTPKQFTSSNLKEKKLKNIVIDITGDTIQVPAVAETPSASESIFHSSIMIDQEARFDRWVKKLYTLRQKAITDLLHSNLT